MGFVSWPSTIHEIISLSKNCNASFFLLRAPASVEVIDKRTYSTVVVGMCSRVARLAERGGKWRSTPFSPGSLPMRPLATCCGASYGSRPPRWGSSYGLPHSDRRSPRKADNYNPDDNPQFFRTTEQQQQNFVVQNCRHEGIFSILIKKFPGRHTPLVSLYFHGMHYFFSVYFSDKRFQMVICQIFS